jgi:hypothetical protein
LRASAQQRAQETRQRAEEAINLLVSEGRPVNFKTVGQPAQVSTAWLYQQEDLKERILHLRAQERPRPKVPIPQRERASDASKDAMIAALRERVKRLEEENRELKRQIEVAYGLLHQQA